MSHQYYIPEFGHPDYRGGPKKKTRKESRPKREGRKYVYFCILNFMQSGEKEVEIPAKDYKDLFRIIQTTYKFTTLITINGSQIK